MLIFFLVDLSFFLLLLNVNGKRKINLNIRTNPASASCRVDNERPGCLKIRMHRPEKIKTDNNNNTVENPFGPLSFVYRQVYQKKPQERKTRNTVEIYAYTKKNLVWRASNWLGSHSTRQCFFRPKLAIFFYVSTQCTLIPLTNT